MNDEMKEFTGRIAFSNSIDIPEEFDKQFIIGGIDNVNNPSHYQGRYGMKSIDALRNFMTPEQLKGFFLGNSLKYLLRHQKKNGLEDLKKARKNLDWLIEELENENKNIEWRNRQC
jgi:hypothetical protein|nr:MAG TPA: nucelotide kinase [Caudoviricetes sp.]